MRHLLGRVAGILAGSAQRSVEGNDDGWDGPAQAHQPLDQLVLARERTDEERVQVEALAQHPRIVRQQEVVEDHVQHSAHDLRREQRGAVSRRISFPLFFMELGFTRGWGY